MYRWGSCEIKYIGNRLQYIIMYKYERDDQDKCDALNLNIALCGLQQGVSIVPHTASTLAAPLR